MLADELTPEIIARFCRHLLRVRLEVYCIETQTRAQRLVANDDRPAWMRL